MDTPLQGKTALVTGAARGLGRAYALHLARLGADVAIIDQNLKSFEEYEAEQALMTAGSTMDEVAALGRRSLGFEADVGNRDALAAAVHELLAAWGRIDIAVCNAGGGLGAPADTKASEVDAELFDAVLKRNLYGTVNTCALVAPSMKEQRYGKIITVSSQAGRRASTDGGYAHYGTAKAGIIMYTRYLAQELGPYNITVNCIAPGYIGTGRLNVMFERAGVDRIASGVALRRIGTPEDCAKVVGFLAGPDSDYVTGTVIPIDGGSTP
ncbi:MAG TPA: SDR family NAD(P)-dependent oxidoreductase [Tepidiformaceae bacterium]|nr:SDR family NAD(P)-dependent oxidoreductase [Tepidiformaceae bacterium]